MVKTTGVEKVLRLLMRSSAEECALHFRMTQAHPFQGFDEWAYRGGLVTGCPRKEIVSRVKGAHDTFIDETPKLGFVDVVQVQKMVQSCGRSFVAFHVSSPW